MRKREAIRGLVAGLCLLCFGLSRARAQGNYEIQVYGAETVAPRTMMVEVHSNFTPKGQRNTIDGVYPTNHQQHETLELTQGITNWPPRSLGTAFHS